MSCVHKVILQPTTFTFQDFPIYLCELIKLILRLTHFRFPEDSIYGIPGLFPMYQDCFPGVRMSQEDLHFLSPIQFDSWLASPLDFPKVLVNFRLLTMIFPLWGFPRGFHISIYYAKKSLCNLVIRSVFSSMWAIALECSKSPIPRCMSLIISIWRSLSSMTNLFL